MYHQQVAKQVIGNGTPFLEASHVLSLASRPSCAGENHRGKALHDCGITRLRKVTNSNFRPGVSGKNLLHHVPLHIRETEVATGIEIGEPFMVEPHKVQDGGVKIVDAHGIFHSSETKQLSP